MTAACPFTFDISRTEGIPSGFDSHLERRLSNMRGYYADGERYEAMLAREDVVLYEVYQILRPETPGDDPRDGETPPAG